MGPTPRKPGLGFLAAIPVAFVCSVMAQQSQTPTPAPPTFRSSTRLIVTTVVVKDRNGTPIEGLTASDFIVTEENEPQEIAFVVYQRLDDQPPLPPFSALQVVDAALSPASPVTDVPSVVQPGIKSPPPGDVNFQNRRLLVLYFDLSTPPGADHDRMFAAARKYLEQQMTALDLIAIMTFRGGAVRVKQDFTDDRARLGGVIDALANGQDLDNDGVLDFVDFGSAFGQNDSEFNFFSTDRQLAGLQTAVGMLRELPQQKALVYFTAALSFNPTENIAQMRATINAAIRANVSLFPVDARGLVAMAPLGGADRRSPGGIGMFTGALATQAFRSLSRSQDILHALASDTGGTPFLNYNDLSMGISQAAAAQGSYYVIGFYSTRTSNDGKFRRIQVRLADETLRADVSHRPGYYADKEWARQNGIERERQLEEALMLENPVTEITIALEVHYFQLNRAEYFVPVTVKIPGSELALAQRRGAQRLTLDFLAEVKDAFGATQRNGRDKMEIRLTGEKAELIETRPVQYETGFTLLPGTYVLKFLVRDAAVGRIGTYETSFTIPNLNREETQLPISTVVLGSQRLAVNQALYNVKAMGQESVGHPLIYGGLKLLPSVTRVFSASRGDMHVYLEAYEKYADAMLPLVAFATFYRDGVKAFETRPMAITEGIDRTSRAIPIRFSIPLQDLPVGRYDWQVSVIEPTGQKAAFWRAPIAIVP